MIENKTNINDTLILVYNTMWGEDLDIPFENIPSNVVITTDRSFFTRADAVVFHLPDLFNHLTVDLEKQEGQLWVAWCLESVENYPWIKNSEIADLFDLWMTYRQDADVVYPNYRHEYSELVSQPVSANHKQEKTCMFISSHVNQSGRMEYLKELMQHIRIDSYGKLYNNKQLSTDLGRETKLDIFRNYKFVIAFENAIDPDYVTEKFFDPLIAGSVPVYLGAPNVEEFAPGNHCFVDVRQFQNPQSLAQFIQACCDDEQLYATFFEWKNQAIQASFLRKTEAQKEHPWIRLCQKIKERLLENRQINK